MTDPYYQDSLVTLYHGDSREITDWADADVLVTDPPYGMSFQSGVRRSAKLARIAGDGDTQARDAILRLWGSERPALVFGHWSQPAPAGERQRLIWHKAGTPGMGNLAMPWGTNFEDIHVLGQGWDREAAGIKRTGAVITTREQRGGGFRCGERHRSPDSEARRTHGTAHRGVPAGHNRRPLRGERGDAGRCPEPGAPVDRRRTGGGLLRDRRVPPVRAGARPVGGERES